MMVNTPILKPDGLQTESAKMLTLRAGSLLELFQLAPRLEQMTYEHKIVLIRGLKPLKRGTFIEFASTVARRRSDKFIEWDFGTVMELKEDPSATNYLFTKERVPFHWDGAFHDSPGILAFNCLTPAAEGGATLFVDTERLWSSFDSEEQAKLSKLTFEYETEKKAHYGGKIEVPLVQIHQRTHQTILRFGEEVETLKNPVKRRLLSTDLDTTALISELESRLRSNEWQQRIEWRQGDILLADNQSLLHGREAFTSSVPRHIRRIQLR